MIFLDMSNSGARPILLVCSRANKFTVRAGAAHVTAVGALHGVLGAKHRFGCWRLFVFVSLGNTPRAD